MSNKTGNCKQTFWITLACLILLIFQNYVIGSETYHQDKLCARHDMESKTTIYNTKTSSYRIICTKN